MKKLFIILLLLFYTGVHAQKKMVLIEGFKTINILDFHEIAVEDDLTAETINTFVFYMENNPIDYERAIKKIRAIKSIQKDKSFVGNFKDGVIYLNSRLDNMPATKQIVILHYLAVNLGLKTRNSSLPNVRNTRFNISDRNEEMFQRQLNSDYVYKYLVKELEKVSPLKSKL